MNASTHPIHSLLRAAAVASIASLAVLAQEPKDRGTMPDRTQDHTMAPAYTSTDRLVGAKVALAPSAEEKVEADRKGEKPDAPTGTAIEWLVDAHDGAVQYAVISTGGLLGIGDRTVLVPASDLRWNQAKEQFQLHMTPQQLEARTPFDLDKACETGLDAAAKTAGGPLKNERGTTEASAKPVGKVQDTSFVAANCRLCKASELSTLPVHAGNDEFGKVSDLIVDRGQHQIVLAVVDHGTTLGMGGTAYLVPFDKLTPCSKNGDAGELDLLCVPGSTKEELKKSVVYEKPQDGVVDPSAAKQALASATRRQ